MEGITGEPTASQTYRGGGGQRPRVPAPGEPWTPILLTRWSGGYLSEKGVEGGRLDAELILAHVLGVGRLDLYLQHDRPLSPLELASFKGLLKWLIQGYKFDIEGLYRRDGTVLPLPAESSVVGKIVECTLIAHLQAKLLQVSELDSIPATSDRVYPDITFTGPAVQPVSNAS